MKIDNKDYLEFIYFRFLDEYSEDETQDFMMWLQDQYNKKSWVDKIIDWVRRIKK